MLANGGTLGGSQAGAAGVFLAQGGGRAGGEDADQGLHRAFDEAEVGAADLPPDEFLSREVDPILDKIAKSGIGSLTAGERRALDRARNRLLKKPN